MFDHVPIFFLTLHADMDKVGSNKNKIVKYLRSIKTRRTSLRLQQKMKKALPENEPQLIQHPLGLFSNIPDEVSYYIFLRIPLYDLASLALTSRALRDKVISFYYSAQALPILIPDVKPEGLENKQSTYLTHFHNLGKFKVLLQRIFRPRF
jgi:hypothetical protein